MCSEFTEIERDVAKTSLGAALPKIREEAATILGQLRASGLFGEYTEHDINHAKEMLQICQWIIPSAIILNPIEKYLLVLSVYFHDIGMVICSDEKSTIEQCHELEVSSSFYSETYSSFEATYKKKHPIALRDEILQEYIRETHHLRSARYVLKNGRSLGVDPRLIQTVADLCCSHCERQITKQFPVDWPFNESGEINYVNLQFIAILLRLSDILDTTNMRTPEILFTWISPKSEQSLHEWERQMSVFSVAPRRSEPHIIDIAGETTCPDIYFDLEQYQQRIMAEIEYVRGILLSYDPALAARYFLNIEKVSLEKIRAVNFEPVKMEISIDKERIVNLFMGNNIYIDSESAAIRELLLNAIDACRLRASQENPCNYQPEIEIILDSDQKTCIIKDNGTGMNRYIIENFLLKVGRSFYSSDDFAEIASTHRPMSRFGIGFLSSFLIANKVEVTTRYYKNEDNPQTHLEIRDVNQYVVVRNVTALPVAGTTIKLHLKQPLLRLEEIIKYWVHHLEFDVKLTIDGSKTIVTDNKFDFNLECTYYTEAKLPIEQKKIPIEGPGFNGAVWVFLADSEFVNVDRLSGDDNIEMNDFVRCTNSDGVLVTTAMPVPTYLYASCFMHDINISRSKCELIPMLNREGVIRNDDWQNICREVEKVLIPKLFSIAEQLECIESKKSQQFLGNFINFGQFQKNRPSPEMASFLMSRLKWAKHRTQGWNTLFDLSQDGIELLPEVHVKSYPSLVPAQGYDLALVKCKEIRDLHGTNTVYMSNFKDALDFLPYEFVPEQINISSYGYSTLRCVRQPHSGRWDNILQLPFYFDGQPNDNIAMTLIGSLLVYNQNHPWGSLVKAVRSSKDIILNKDLNIILNSFYSRSELYLASRKQIDSLSVKIQELNRKCRTKGYVAQEITFAENSFAIHDLVEFWL